MAVLAHTTRDADVALAEELAASMTAVSRTTTTFHNCVTPGSHKNITEGSVFYRNKVLQAGGKQEHFMKG